MSSRRCRHEEAWRARVEALNLRPPFPFRRAALSDARIFPSRPSGRARRWGAPKPTNGRAGRPYRQTVARDSITIPMCTIRRHRLHRPSRCRQGCGDGAATSGRSTRVYRAARHARGATSIQCKEPSAWRLPVMVNIRFIRFVAEGDFAAAAQSSRRQCAPVGDRRVSAGNTVRNRASAE